MKKTLVALSAVVLMLVGMVGSASAVPIYYKESTELNTSYSGGYYSWQIVMPGDFEIPFDSVSSAFLTINTQSLDSNNDLLTIVNKYTLNRTGSGDLGNLSYTWTNPLDTVLNVKPIFIAPWENGSLLNVGIVNIGWINDPIFLVDAVLELTYENKDKVAPVPEPGTMVLLGFGMLGLVIYGKRRMNRDV